MESRVDDSTLRQYLRLRHIPGPPSAGISQWWLIRAVGGGRTHLDLYEACQKYELTEIDNNIVAWLNLLETKYVSANQPFDLARKEQYLTLDVISDLAFGEPFGDVATDSDVHEYISTMETNMPNIIVTTAMPWLMVVLSSHFCRWMLPSEKDVIGLGHTMAIAKQVAAERFGPQKKVQRDMLGSFVARALTQSEAESEILMQILAGSDTTATAIRATMLHIMRNARVGEGLRNEIEQANPSWPVITDAEARRMPYLQAVIKEGLRMFPPVAGLMAKEVPKGGDTFKGTFFPEGTRIGYCAWGVFRPERWLEASPEKLREMDGTVELVFGYGRWQCLGRNVAFIELNKVFVELSCPEETRVENILTIADGTTALEASDLWVKAYRRANATAVDQRARVRDVLEADTVSARSLTVTQDATGRIKPNGEEGGMGRACPGALQMSPDAIITVAQHRPPTAAATATNTLQTSPTIGPSKPHRDKRRQQAELPQTLLSNLASRTSNTPTSGLPYHLCFRRHPRRPQRTARLAKALDRPVETSRVHFAPLPCPPPPPPPPAVRPDPTLMSAKVTRACDACWVRKVRCSGDQPCAQCAHLNLACAFAPPPAKRKPGVRGRLVAQLRNKTAAEATNGRPGAAAVSSITSPAAASTSSSASSPTSGGAVQLPAVTSIAGIVDSNHAVSPRFELAPASGGGGYSQDFMRLLPEYDKLVYPVNPVLTPDELRASIQNMHSSYEDAALVHAFGAVTINLTQTSLWAHRKAEMGRDTDAHYLQCEMPMTVKRVMVGIWNEISLMAFKPFDRSFASLRESITMIQMLNIQQYSEDNPCGLSRREISRQQRMYWEAYIHERFMCIMSGFPCTMIPLRTGLPMTDADVPPTEEQHVDLFVTRLWLRTLVWQLALSHGLLRSAPPRDAHEGLSLHFPAQRLSAQLRGLVSRLGNMSTFVIHGSGILQKLFEITSTVADVLALPRGPGQTQEEARARIEDFLFLVRFIFGFERTQKHQRDYLREKLDALREMYTVVDFGDLAGSPAAR
ncbi:transcriptional regulator family: Fungal Specific TF [Purpureocillium lilacinum]|uniref:Transcriptional regulator family: Fungal Specific TF n=1 Tax=Purpureocillium lilacinum TaxID=33203 RepID=A0ABR0BDI6_PURLI|nr:transcriptional regulator family: Fungal Specific TF [Purpureocillium lilacinum]